MHHTDVPLSPCLVCHVQDKHNSLAVYDWKEERLLFTACTTKVRNAHHSTYPVAAPDIPLDPLENWYFHHLNERDEKLIFMCVLVCARPRCWAVCSRRTTRSSRAAWTTSFSGSRRTRVRQTTLCYHAPHSCMTRRGRRQADIHTNTYRQTFTPWAPFSSPPSPCVGRLPEEARDLRHARQAAVDRVPGRVGQSRHLGHGGRLPLPLGRTQLRQGRQGTHGTTKHTHTHPQT